VIDGISFAALDVGFAWNDPEAAIADATEPYRSLRLRS